MPTVKGNIYDAITKQPVPGANVFVSNAAGLPVPAKATQSTSSGAYNLPSVKLNEYVTFQMMGYQTQTVLANMASGDIYFEPSLVSLQDGTTLFSKERTQAIALALAGAGLVWAWNHRNEIESFLTKKLKTSS